MSNRLAAPGEINGDPIDRFTAVHFASGAVYGLLGLPLWTSAVMAIFWEVMENPLKDRFPGAFPNPTHDRLGNAVFDAVAFVAGSYTIALARRE